MEIQNLFKYYNRCYQEDNAGTKIENIFSKNVENKYFLADKDQLITQFLPYAPIENKYAEETLKKIKISQQNKELVYCSLFIIGKTDKKTVGNNKICSPILIYPAEIIKIDADFFVKIDTEHRRINFGIFSEIIDDEKQIPNFHEELYQIIGTNPINLTIISQISNLLEKYSTAIDTKYLLEFPNLTPKKEIQNLSKREIITQEGKFLTIAASVLAIIKKSVNTRGIINELNELSKTNTFSTPIRTIFANENFSPENTNTKKIGEVPSLLNADQENIILNSEKFPFSLIIGPPGTGKSYTLATLAIEKITKGKSVLIAAATDKAINVIAHKIENQLKLKNIIVSTNNKEYKQNLIEHINNTIRNKTSKNNTKSSTIHRNLKNINRKLNKIQNLFQTRVNEELKWGKYIAENSEKNTFFVNLRKKYINFRNEYSENHWEIENEMQNLFSSLITTTNEYIHQKYNEQLNQYVKKDLQSVNLFLNALKSKKANWQNKHFSKLNYNTVFKIFPIWLVKMSDIYRYLPLTAELFDYVIIDEATQSNIAQAVPILQRGKKAIITGDPKQLRHFSFLSAAKQNIFKEKYKLINFPHYITNYKNNSLLDIMSQSTKNTLQFNSLNEHYRSMPAIIRFSNKTFYNNNLKIMNSRPDLAQNQGIEIIKTKGTRNKQGYNDTEAQIIIGKIKNIITNENDLNKNVCSSIGILSPFRDQVEHITKLITTNFNYQQIQKHDININTAYGFQGDERDIMILSFAADNNTNATAFRYLNKDDVFNVSISRARKKQIIIYSVDHKNLKTTNLLRRYIESFQNNTTQKNTQKFYDSFLTEVQNLLETNNFKTWSNYKIAGLNIDLVVKKNNNTLGIDLIGFPGQFEQAFTIERYKMLNRAGLKTFPLPYTLWKINKQKCINEINNEMKI